VLLAINTSTLQFSIALLAGDGSLLGEYYLGRGTRHFGGLVPAVDFLLAGLGRGKEEIECVAIAIGPGSFTGIRVGLSFAKGVCHVLKVPIVGISSLDALAAQIAESTLAITALIESRRNDVFVAQFRRGPGGQLTRLMSDQCVEYSALTTSLALPCIFVGNNYHNQVPKLKETLKPDLLLAPPEMWAIRACTVGALGLRRFLSQDFDNPAALVPIYLRPPDIRPNPYLKT